MKRKQKKKKEDFSYLIKKAEKAVKNVKNERLQEIAFERVLDHLLNTSIGQTRNLGRSAMHSHGATSLLKTPDKSTKASGTLAWLQELVDENFFSDPKSSRNILDELNTRSHRLKPSDLTWALQELCHKKKLRREKQSPAGGGKKVYHWFNR